MTLKGRARRDERGKSAGRAEAREREKQQLIPATLRRLSETTDDGRDYWVLTGKRLCPSLPRVRYRNDDFVGREFVMSDSCYG